MKKQPRSRGLDTGSPAALRSAGLVLPRVLRGRGYAVDDLLDACAVAWTARRVARGEALSLPDPPEVFGRHPGRA